MFQLGSLEYSSAKIGIGLHAKNAGRGRIPEEFLEGFPDPRQDPAMGKEELAGKMSGQCQTAQTCGVRDGAG